MVKMPRFMAATYAAFLARQKPVSTSMKPACMKKISADADDQEEEVRADLEVPEVLGDLDERRVPGGPRDHVGDTAGRGAGGIGRVGETDHEEHAHDRKDRRPDGSLLHDARHVPAPVVVLVDERQRHHLLLVAFRPDGGKQRTPGAVRVGEPCVVGRRHLGFAGGARDREALDDRHVRAGCERAVSRREHRCEHRVSDRRPDRPLGRQRAILSRARLRGPITQRESATFARWRLGVRIPLGPPQNPPKLVEVERSSPR